jgi:aspartate/methionine/tyrosine aminotransferase
MHARFEIAPSRASSVLTHSDAAADSSARGTVRSLVASQIREVANAGMGDPDILAFWFGEPDEVTPVAIREAAMAALEAGETFYTQNFGIPELREALAAYMARLHGSFSSDRIAVTASGMSALMLATQALVSHGDRVVCVTPLWPNLTEIPKILGANVVRVALQFGKAGWSLDVGRPIDALVPGTCALMINSPNNPTGWTLRADEQRTILEHCRKHGIWILADDVYERLYYGDSVTDTDSGIGRGDATRTNACAPSFLDIGDAGDRLVSSNSFSKTWLMTGWRLGWLAAPPALMPDLGKLIEYNTSCSPVFVQRAGVVAVERGEPGVAHTVSRLRHARDHLTRALRDMPRVEIASPPGAMYAFFRVDGVIDSLDFCKRLVREARLGLAPGSAFGREGEGFVRWCFAASDDRLADGIARLSRFLQQR